MKTINTTKIHQKFHGKTQHRLANKLSGCYHWHMKTNSSFVPPKKKWLMVLLCVGVSASFLFAAALWISLTSPHIIDAGIYLQDEPLNFVYQVDTDLDSLYGYALVEGEKFESVHITAVLFDKAEDAYFSIPTSYVRDESINILFNEPLNYHHAGFSATLLPGRLPKPLSTYEVCLLYKANGHANLVHTGQYLEDTAA